MGVGGASSQGSDDDRSRSGAAPAADGRAAARRARRRRRRRTARCGRAPGATGTLEPGARLPEVRRFRVPTGGIVRVLPRAGGTVVDGSAQAVAGLAGFGALRTDRPLRYAADLDPRRAALARAPAAPRS